MCFHNRFTLYWLALNDLLALPADLSTVRKRIGQASWWVNETPSEVGGSCALFIHLEHSWQPVQALMQRKGERNRKWSCYISLFHKTVLLSRVHCQYACLWGSLGSRGRGRRRQEEDEWRERFCTETPQNKESIHLCQALPVSHFTLCTHCFLRS